MERRESRKIELFSTVFDRLISIDSRGDELGMTSLCFPRETLLIEIERYCSSSECAAKNRIGLTKPEAIEYRGFECFRCQYWNDDRLRAAEVPDSWSEVKDPITNALE